MFLRMYYGGDGARLRALPYPFDYFFRVRINLDTVSVSLGGADGSAGTLSPFFIFFF